MALTLNQPYLGLRAALSGSSIVFIPREGICDGIVLNQPYIGLRAATSDDKVVYLISDQQLTMGDKLVIGKPYIGLRAAQSSGALVYLVQGVQCVPDPYCCVEDSRLDNASLIATLAVAGMPFSPFSVSITRTVGGPFEECNRFYSGTIGAIIPGGSAWTITVRLGCMVPAACAGWRARLNVESYDAGTATLYRLRGDMLTDLSSLSPVIFDTMSTNAIYPYPSTPSSGCCPEYGPGFDPDVIMGEWRCEVWSDFANLSGAAVTMDISE